MFNSNMDEKDIPIGDISIDEDTKRRIEMPDIVELANNIKENGLMQPITVIENKENGTYTVLAGSRRLFAFIKLNTEFPNAGWDKIPCHVIQPPEDGEGKIIQ